MTHYSDGGVALHHGDCLDILRELPDNSVDSVVTDPPYGLEFMGKDWDSFKTYAGGNPNMKPQGATVGDSSAVTHGLRTKNPRCRRCGKLMRGNGSCKCPEPQPDTRTAEGANQFQFWCEDWARECLRALKPGGHLLAFGGTRTSHRLACAVEDAGFEIRDSIAWLYGSGFPKSLDVSKAIDKAAGAEREVVGTRRKLGLGGSDTFAQDAWTQSQRGMIDLDVTAPATDDARTWQGWGTALKPAHEPIVVARKPLTGTVSQNVLTHGTGALNVDGCRVDAGGERFGPEAGGSPVTTNDVYGKGLGVGNGQHAAGRWPANVVLDESQAEALDAQSGESASSKPGSLAYGAHEDTGRNETYGAGLSSSTPNQPPYGDQGGASRFFYVAKADASERVRVAGVAHPTVKPLALMRWLVRLVTPPGGTVLEPFAGSGTTVEACIREGFRCVAIEREADYLPLILKRIERGRGPNVRARSAAPPDLDDSLLSFLETDQETA